MEFTTFLFIFIVIQLVFAIASWFTKRNTYLIVFLLSSVTLTFFGVFQYPDYGFWVSVFGIMFIFAILSRIVSR